MLFPTFLLECQDVMIQLLVQITFGQHRAQAQSSQALGLNFKREDSDTSGRISVLFNFAIPNHYST